jgi:hypothetical protein
VLDLRFTTVIGLIVLQVGCSPGTASRSQVPVRTPTTVNPGVRIISTRVVAIPAESAPESVTPSTVIAIETPSPEPESAEATALRTALEGPLRMGRWTELAAHFCEEVMLVTSSERRSLTRAQATEWLQARWQPNVAIRDVFHSPHFAAMELPTGPWRTVPPSGATITLGAHLLDASCQGSIFGQWRIDVISAT